MHTDYDIGIIGGGLAGLSLALLAADAVIQLYCLKKKIFLFIKYVANISAMKAIIFYILLGLPLPGWNLPSIKKLVVSDTKGSEYKFKARPRRIWNKPLYN
jgi:hypothetical protein